MTEIIETLTTSQLFRLHHVNKQENATFQTPHRYFETSLIAPGSDSVTCVRFPACMRFHSSAMTASNKQICHNNRKPHPRQFASTLTR